MEAREVPAAFGNGIALASYNGTVDSTVNIYNAVSTAPQTPTVVPFAGYRGPIVTAAGDVNGDGVSDVIVGAQAPNGHVKVFDGTTGALMQSFLAFPGFNGAVSVGSADVNGDGYADVLVSASATNAHVKAISGRDGALLSSFLAFPGFLGQVAVSGADFDGDGLAEIIVGAGGPGVNGRVALFNANGALFNAGFFAFPGFNGAISVAGGDVNGDGIADIVVGAGPGAPGGAVEAFSGAGFGLIDSFVPFAPTVTNGVDVFVADGNLDGRGDLFVALHGGGLASMRGLVPLAAFDGRTGRTLAQSGGGDGTYSGVDNGSTGDVFGAGSNYTSPSGDTSSNFVDNGSSGDVFGGYDFAQSSGDTGYSGGGDTTDYGGDPGANDDPFGGAYA